MADLRLCPFCGGSAEVIKENVRCSAPGCFQHYYVIPYGEWQKRPTEYALATETTKLKAVLRRIDLMVTDENFGADDVREVIEEALE